MKTLKEEAKHLMETYLKKIIELSYAETKTLELARECALIDVNRQLDLLSKLDKTINIRLEIKCLEGIKQAIKDNFN